MIIAAEEVPSEQFPVGEVTKHEFQHSQIFPGTTRDYWVYVPQQYDPRTPACVFVCQDGIQYNAPAVLDELIAQQQIPVMIGIFVMHGRVKAPRDEAGDRYNRSFEYDGLSDDYARFLLEELFPEVEKLTTSDGRPIRLSQSGNDRAIGGNSSGAICAFTAAWERPDAFTRVFSAIGTYVGLRGGNIYPTLVRKVAPKPIRVFLQDGSNDLNIYGGDWWMANQELDRALVFAGYEVTHVWGEGGHNSEQATQVFSDGMRYLWHDWPEPVKVGAGSPQLQELLVPGADWELVGEGYRFTEGPAVNAAGEVFFNDVGRNKAYRINAEGQPIEFLVDAKGGDGQAFGSDGRLFAASGSTESILAWLPDGTSSVVAEGFRGNDVVALSNGHIYVTQPGWNGNDPSQVWHIRPDGTKEVVDRGLKFANGITTSPDQTLLYVSDTKSHWVYSYQIQGDGKLAFKQRYYHLHVPDTADDSGADGLEVDREGRLYIATRMGIQVCDQPGRVNCMIPTPNRQVSNIVFGGSQFDTLYATCGDKVYRRKWKVRGAPSLLAPVKPPVPRL